MGLPEEGVRPPVTGGREGDGGQLHPVPRPEGDGPAGQGGRTPTLAGEHATEGMGEKTGEEPAGVVPVVGRGGRSGVEGGPDVSGPVPEKTDEPQGAAAPTTARPGGEGAPAESETVPAGTEGSDVAGVSGTDSIIEDLLDLSGNDIDSLFDDVATDMEGIAVDNPPPTDLGPGAPHIEKIHHKIPKVNFRKDYNRSPENFGTWWENRNKIFGGCIKRERIIPKTPKEALKRQGLKL